MSMRALFAGLVVFGLVLGACGGSDDSLTSQTSALRQGKVLICHHTEGANPWLLIRVAEAALPAHMGHGDKYPTTYYADADGDGYGDPNDPGEVACEDPGNGQVPNNGDCDDENAAAFPGNEEICDQVDNDCDGEVDEGDVCESPSPECEGASCNNFLPCNEPNDCTQPVCVTTAESGGVCVEGRTPCLGLLDCETSADCPGAQPYCAVQTCCGRPVCLNENHFCLTNQGLTTSLQVQGAGLEADGPTLGGM